jgi:hypothetical protein
LETRTWFRFQLSENEVQKLPPTAQSVFAHYGFFHPDLEAHILSSDDDRFTNHSDNANVKFHGEHAIAIRDIQEGKEITDNYTEFGKSVCQETRPPMGAA